MLNFSSKKIIANFGLATACILILASCSGRRIDRDAPIEDPKDQRIENLTSALSRTQTRLEELDAKLSALTDKVESTKLIVDNLAGNKPLKTEAVGSAQSALTLPEDGEKKLSEHESKFLKKKLGEKSLTERVPLHGDAATSEFQKAMSLFKAGKYSDASLAFSHFTETYPEHILAGSAQFFVGESYLMMGEYKLAINEYGKVVSSFGSSPRAATALVRIAHSYDAIGNANEAARTMALARDLYDGNPSLDLAPPTKIAKASAPTAKIKNQELNAAPIEPAVAPEKLQEKQLAPDEKKDDNLEDKL